MNSKYATTYSDIEIKKESAAGSLIQMIDGLSGSKDDLDGLAEFKKYMGVKMEKNNKTPKLRFSGYTDDWEQRKLGEITVESPEYATLETGLPLYIITQRTNVSK